MILPSLLDVPHANRRRNITVWQKTMTSILTSKQEIVMNDFPLLSLEQPTMLHESRASDALVYDGVAEIRRLTCAKIIWPSPYNASNTNDRLC